MFFVGLMMGGMLGVCLMCLMQIAKDDARIKYMPDCQIHQDYACDRQTECKGNPVLCKSARMKI